ncbi:hypothetical protein T11_4592 [Trichinella zimbabwensis]|uniref:Uncharacterized protein n=1 Tax=Trichinella zimbabwensis TaxID=268475 RepID=A0A0V1HL38_9BILA|nr:hypothetical protein T11_4592 [Trichinella zimbabwensis]
MIVHPVKQHSEYHLTTNYHKIFLSPGCQSATHQKGIHFRAITSQFSSSHTDQGRNKAYNGFLLTEHNIQVNIMHFFIIYM